MNTAAHAPRISVEAFPLTLVAVANDDDGDHDADGDADYGHDDDEHELPAADAVRHEAALRVFHVICNNQQRSTNDSE